MVVLLVRRSVCRSVTLNHHRRRRRRYCFTLFIVPFTVEAAIHDVILRTLTKLKRSSLFRHYVLLVYAIAHTHPLVVIIEKLFSVFSFLNFNHLFYIFNFPFTELNTWPFLCRAIDIYVK